MTIIIANIITVTGIRTINDVANIRTVTDIRTINDYYNSKHNDC